MSISLEILGALSSFNERWNFGGDLEDWERDGAQRNKAGSLKIDEVASCCKKLCSKNP